MACKASREPASALSQRLICEDRLRHLSDSVFVSKPDSEPDTESDSEPDSEFDRVTRRVPLAHSRAGIAVGAAVGGVASVVGVALPPGASGEFGLEFVPDRGGGRAGGDFLERLRQYAAR